MKSLVCTACAVIAFSIAPDAAMKKADAARLESATRVAREVGPSVATDYWQRARCVVILPELKKTAFIINIGRGMTTRLEDLVEALRAGEIAGAGLDVFEQEPLPADHPLWTTPGVLLTPHVAGYGPYLDERRYEIILDNCRRFLAGQPLRNLVDKARWF